MKIGSSARTLRASCDELNRGLPELKDLQCVWHVCVCVCGVGQHKRQVVCVSVCVCV